MNKLIPEKLINARTAVGITKAEAARRLNLSKMGYGRYESGEREPSPQMIQVIAEGLGTSVDYLTGMTDDISADKICIYKTDSPELYDFVLECQNADSTTLKRILAYYQSLSGKDLTN